MRLRGRMRPLRGVARGGRGRRAPSAAWSRTIAVPVEHVPWSDTGELRDAGVCGHSIHLAAKQSDGSRALRLQLALHSARTGRELFGHGQDSGYGCRAVRELPVRRAVPTLATLMSKVVISEDRRQPFPLVVIEGFASGQRRMEALFGFHEEASVARSAYPMSPKRR